MSLDKVKFVCSVNCPFCGGDIKVLKKTRILKPSVQAEKEEQYIAEKGTQTTLFKGKGEQQ